MPGRLTAEYAEVEYQQFRSGGALRAARRVLGVLTWPVTWPLGMLARVSPTVFRTLSELFAGAPYVFGVVVRQEFYRFALRRCGRNVFIEYGTVFIHRDVEIGDNVLIGRYNVIHHCDFGDWVLTGERCTFLSGARQHRFERRDVPMALQGGQMKRISIGRDAWIASHSVVMEDVGEGAVVGAGSVVTRPVPAYRVVAGSPAVVRRERGEAGRDEGGRGGPAADPTG